MTPRRGSCQRSYRMFIIIVLSLFLIPVSFSTSIASDTNTLLIIDASGSMRAQMGSASKMDIAKEVVRDYITSLPSGMNVGLMAYGHRTKGDCKDVEYLVPVGKNNRKQLVSTVDGLTPKGKTPIALSLEKAVTIVDTLPGQTTIILVSDGKESCNTDPCALVETYIAQGKPFVSHVIGFDVDRRARKELECIARAGKGNYFPADDINGLKVAFEDVKKALPVAAPPKKQRTSQPRPIKLKSGTITLQKHQFIAGERIWVHYSTPDIYDAKAWIGIVPSSIPHGSEAVNDDHDITYQYLKGKQTGDLEFRAPGTPGKYDFRMHDTDDKGIEVAHVTFDVIQGSASLSLSKTALTSGEAFDVTFETAVKLSPKAWVGIIPSSVPHGDEAVNDNHDIAYKYLGENRTGILKFVAPSEPGQYDMRLHDTDDNGSEIASVPFTVTRGAGTLSLEKTSFQSGETIVVTFSTSAKLVNNAWVGIIPSTVPHGEENRNDKFDIAYQYLSGKSSGRLEFTAPSEPGTYDFRLNDTDDNGNELAHVTFTVNPATGSITLNKALFSPGEEIRVTFNTSVVFKGSAWIGIIPSTVPHGDENVNDNHDIAYQYIKGQQHGTLTFKAPETPGAYDFRMNDSDDGGREVTSVSFSVR